jgi:hypothetical protein
VIVLDAAVPWIPKATLPAKQARIIHISSDPLVLTVPFRDFESDAFITATPASALQALIIELNALKSGMQSAISSRRTAVATRKAEIDQKRKTLLEKGKSQTPIDSAWLSACVNAAKHKDAIIVNELGLNVAHLNMETYGSYIGGNMSGGLGFGLGAALGAKLAAPDREVIAVVGDGSYMFGNPLPYHFVARAEKLPTLTIVANNHAWHAVRNATLSVYPDGIAAKTNIMPLTSLDPSPNFEKMMDVCGGYGASVERPEDLPAALDKALAIVRSGSMPRRVRSFGSFEAEQAAGASHAAARTVLPAQDTLRFSLAGVSSAKAVFMPATREDMLRRSALGDDVAGLELALGAPLPGAAPGERTLFLSLPLSCDLSPLSAALVAPPHAPPPQPRLLASFALPPGAAARPLRPQRTRPHADALAPRAPAPPQWCWPAATPLAARSWPRRSARTP